MASKDDKKEKKGLPTGVVVAIVLIIIALIGGVMWYMHNTKGANATAAALPNAGTPAPGGTAAVASMPSPNNVSAGSSNAAGGRVGAQV
jgi:flagellar basal body-associated protein FliL